MMMALKSRVLTIAAGCMLTMTPAGRASASETGDPTVVVRWNRTLLQAVRDTRMAPPPVARAVAMVHTAIYDAWAAYDSRAAGTRFGRRLRRPAAERTESNKAEAISYAAHRTLADLFPSRRADLFDPLMIELGYSLNAIAPESWSAAAVGTLAAEAVLAFRHGDGANQLGDLTASGTPYADYTGYRPVNDALTLHDPNHWQPLIQPNGQPQTFLMPQWSRVRPFALSGPSQFRPPVPPAYGTAEYWNQAVDLVVTSGRLTDRTKAIAVYWADGPSTETPPGHWMLFAQAVSARDRHTLDDDVKMFFALGNAMLDASIAAWDCKAAFDYIRPQSAIRFLFGGRLIPAWGGPYRQREMIDGGSWQSYLPTPPFPEYVSGHSTFSAAAAAVLEAFTGSAAMGFSVTIPAGTSPIEPGFAPVSDVTLRWATFTEAAEQAGLSRRLGGIHFRAGDEMGRDIGRQVGEQTWRKAVRLFDGKRRGRPHP